MVNTKEGTMTRVLKKIFAFTLLLFPLGEIIRLDFGNGIILKPMDIGIAIVIILWLTNKLIRKESIEPKNIYIPVFLFVASGAFSLLISSSLLTTSQMLVSSLYLVRWVAYAGIFFLVNDFDTNFKKTISNLMIIVGSLIVGFGYVQYFFYSNLRNLYYLGWDEHMYRMFSVFLDPNFAGVFFVLFLLFTLNIFFKKRNFLIGLISLLTLVAVFLTFSRSALIMLIVSVSLLFIIQNKKRLILLLLMITFLILGISSRYFNIENINLFRIASSEARLETAKDALLIIGKNPIFGVGFNAYRYAQIRYGLRVDSQTISHADAGTDNSLLFIIATTGLVGFILYILMWKNILKNVSKNSLAISSITGVFISSLFVNSLFYPLIMLWIWIILALSIKSNN